MNTIPTLSKRDKIFARDECLCYYCGRRCWTASDRQERGIRSLKYAATIDHKTPRSRGGSNDYDNLVTACQFCNTQKHSRTEEEYLLWRVEQVDCEETRL